MAVSDLDEMIRTMQPVRRSGGYVFTDAQLPSDVVVEASVREPEGPSAIIAREDADRLGLTYDFVAVWITLTVHSALSAVGLTAAVSTTLAEHGIPCNVVAGLRHDHLLVPEEAADQAMSALRALAAG